MWVTCQNSKLTNMKWVNDSGTYVNPAPDGTGDDQVGCNWNGNRWVTQGWGGGINDFTFGVNATCNGTRVTGMTWGNDQDAATNGVPNPPTPPNDPAGQLACDWTGARWLSHGWDNECSATVGLNVTCNNGHIAHIHAMQYGLYFVNPNYFPCTQ